MFEKFHDYPHKLPYRTIINYSKLSTDFWLEPSKNMLASGLNYDLHTKKFVLQTPNK